MKRCHCHLFNLLVQTPDSLKEQSKLLNSELHTRIENKKQHNRLFLYMKANGFRSLTQLANVNTCSYIKNKVDITEISDENSFRDIFAAIS